MIRLTIQRKVFLATLTLFLATALLLAGAARWNLEQGFERYTAAKELSHLDRIVDGLQRAYADHGSWDFLQNDPDAWRAIQRPNPLRLREDDELFLRPHPRRAWGPPPGTMGEAAAPAPLPRPNPAPPLNDLFNIGPRLALLDASGRQVAGQADGRRAEAFRPILYLGEVVGNLALAASTPSASALENAFLSAQTRNLLLSGGAALAGCLLAAWWLIRHLLAPVRELAAGAREIARGRLKTRINVTRSDELGELAADFNSMAAQLERAEEARKDWISDASHELRTPLAVLQAEIEALQDGVRKPDEATLGRLHRQVLQLGKLVDDLKSTLNGRGDAMDLKRVSVSPVALLCETLDAFRTRFAAAGLLVEASDCGRRDGWRILGDENRLRQVFANLLENTLRYTNTGGRLRITAGVRQNLLLLRLEDSEPGPPSSAMPRLFDRLFRAETSRSRSHGGSGLGLAICKVIIEAHGGRISAGPSDLGGLSIRIELPLEESK